MRTINLHELLISIFFRSGSFRDRPNASTGVIVSPKPKIGTTFRASTTPKKSTTSSKSTTVSLRQVRLSGSMSFRPVMPASSVTSTKSATAGPLRRASMPTTGARLSTLQPKEAKIYNLTSKWIKHNSYEDNWWSNLMLQNWIKNLLVPCTFLKLSET